MHEIFCKGLAAFDGRGILTRAKRTDPNRFQTINQPKRKRIIRCNHDKIRPFFRTEGEDSVQIRGLNGQTLGDLRNSAVAGGAPDFLNTGIF